MRSIAVSLSLLAGLASGAFAQDSDPIRIGALLSMSGNLAINSEHVLNGAQLALEHLNNEMAGQPVELIVKDDQGRPEIGVTAANELIRGDRVDFIFGVVPSNVMMAVHGPITRSETFLIGAVAGPGPIAGEGCSPFFFSVSFQNDQPAEAVGQFMTEQKVERAYVITADYQAGRDMVAGFQRTFGGEVIGEIYTSLQQTDFSAEISQIRAADPDAIFVFLPGGLGIQWVKQYAQAGLSESIPLYSVNMLDQVSLPAIGDVAVGMYGSSSWGEDIDNPENERFLAGYRARHGSTPSPFSAYGYDSVMLIASAVEKVDGDLSDKDAVRSALREADFESVRGPFSFNTNHFPIQDFHFQRVEDGEQGLQLLSAGSVMAKASDVYAEKCSMQ